MHPTTKTNMEILLVITLLAWVLTFPVKDNRQAQLPQTPPQQAQQAIIIKGVALNSGSDVLIDYFADGVWREEQETFYEHIDKAFLSEEDYNEPLTITSDF
jgi:hypothetical protein